jgi:rubredoxin
MRKFKCSICGYVYDESTGIPEKGIAPGTKWEDIPDSFACPVCGAPKSVFNSLEETARSLSGSAPVQTPAAEGGHVESLKELSAGEISAICSSLAKGCEKQRLSAEMEAFNKIADYFKSKTAAEKGKTLADAAKMLDDDIAQTHPAAVKTARENADRGALRSLVWSEKVSAMTKSLLERFAKEGDSMLEKTKIFVCEICGFIYIGDAPPEVCPVCKVPNFKITQVERR